MDSLLIINIPHQSGPFVTTDEPTLTHHNHPKSLVYIMVHSWCCTFYRFRQMCHDMYQLLWYHTEYFHCPENPLCSHLFILSHFRPTPGNHWSFLTVSIVLSFPACHIVGITQYVAFSDWLLSFSNMHLNFLMSFHGLIAHVFLVLSNIPLSGRTFCLLPSFGDCE